MLQNDDIDLVTHLRQIAGKTGILSYRRFIHEVLYAPNLGYYRKDVTRVGRNENADFYTAESLGKVFRELVIAAVQNIMGKENCRNFTFVEIGAEREKGFEKEGTHDRNGSFLAFKTVHVGDDIKIEKKAIVFANELLDAQAFHRLIYTKGRWCELGVRVENEFTEEILSELSSEVEEIIEDLPKESDEGYRLDLPLGAESLLKKIIEQDWSGLIVLFDYGLLWEDLIHNHPQSTGRAYYKHKQLSDLLKNIGRQDITCHVCWDRLGKILEEYGFQKPKLQRQESFFVHHASSVIEKISEKASGQRLNYERQTLHELLHPAHMGHKFQVLWSKRLN